MIFKKLSLPELTFQTLWEGFNPSKDFFIKTCGESISAAKSRIFKQILKTSKNNFYTAFSSLVVDWRSDNDNEMSLFSHSQLKSSGNFPRVISGTQNYR